ncbi:MAG: putative transcriptional regulator/transcriptional regulator with XRE-family HTH domain [Paracoccaceae bacterium]|jgi:predicted transcriptional regulator/transcriptional regulator with XRE-family HTH domain
MSKTLIGPRLRQLRRDRSQTQAQMAKALGVSASYVNLLENNQRSLSVQMLMALSDVYGIDWRELTSDESAKQVADLRNAMQDPVFGEEKPDLQEMRAAIDHAPRLVDMFLRLHQSHRATLDRVMKSGSSANQTEVWMQSSPETVLHDYFRNHSNYFSDIEAKAEQIRNEHPSEPEEHYTILKNRLAKQHNITVRSRPIEFMSDALRDYNVAERVIYLSQALDHTNRVFQLAHVLCLVECDGLLRARLDRSGITHQQGLSRLQVELANYFAAAYLMPYLPFLKEAERVKYDFDRLAAAFDVSFEQVAHRVTTLQREGARGVPFFFLRVDKAGNVTKRFNSTSFHLAEYGGACPVWNIHTAFRVPGVILPQFVEMPTGERFFTISRTAHRPVFSQQTQDRRLTLTLGCALEHADRIGYATPFNTEDQNLFSPIGINCHLCARQACSQRAHQPIFIELPINANRRGSTRYES